MNKVHYIHAESDDEARVWVATSNDAPSLATEADAIEGLIDKLKIIVPELLDANAELPAIGPVAFELLTRRFETAVV